MSQYATKTDYGWGNDTIVYEAIAMPFMMDYG
jgi:hypothetical protein